MNFSDCQPNRQSWFWLIFLLAALVLFSSGCASLVQNPQSQYPSESLAQLENQKWQIAGKISYANLEDSKQNFVGHFDWQSDQGEFQLNFFNQISNQALAVSGQYNQGPILLISANQELELASLNQLLREFFGFSLAWQDLVLWLCYQMPNSAQNIQLDTENQIISFEYQNLKIEYRSFFEQKIKTNSGLPVKKVKLFNLSQFNSDNQKVSQLRIALHQLRFEEI